MRQIFQNLGFAFAGAAVVGFGIALTFYLVTTEKEIWLILIVNFAWMLVFFGIFIFQAVSQSREDVRQTRQTAGAEASAIRSELAKEITKDVQSEAALLTSSVLAASAACLRDVTEELRAFAKDRPRGRPEQEQEAYLHLKRRILHGILGHIRAVFEADLRGVDTTTWPHNFFKLALFEPFPAPASAEVLQRTIYDYPGFEPSPLTATWQLKLGHPDADSSVVRAFRTQHIQVLENIKSEVEKPTGARRWVDKRDNQSREYESMISVPIVSGIRGEPERRCLGVLVIDTNRHRYFLEDRSFEAFLEKIMNPFRSIMTFALELDTYMRTNEAGLE